MEQRPLRLGDILDDYCPRERRVTNHAVVAMIEENVKQTRCTTCDAEHVYKGGKAPRRKKAEDPTGALYKEVLAGIEEPSSRPVQTAASLEPDTMTEQDDPSDITEPEEVEEVTGEQDDDSQIHMLPPDEGPVHRPLIRAQLPRTEGMKIERQAPEFTIRQNNGRGPAGGGFRGRGNGGGGGQAGNGGGGRGPNQGFGRGPGGGGQPRQGGPRKRSR